MCKAPGMMNTSKWNKREKSVMRCNSMIRWKKYTSNQYYFYNNGFYDFFYFKCIDNFDLNNIF